MITAKTIITIDNKVTAMEYRNNILRCFSAVFSSSPSIFGKIDATEFFCDARRRSLRLPSPASHKSKIVSLRHFCKVFPPGSVWRVFPWCKSECQKCSLREIVNRFLFVAILKIEIAKRAGSYTICGSVNLWLRIIFSYFNRALSHSSVFTFCRAWSS